MSRLLPLFAATLALAGCAGASANMQKSLELPANLVVPASAALHLTVKSSEGQGKLTGVTMIQRIDTKGGKAPEGGCTASQAGQVQKVPYTATYLFYSAQ